MSFIISHVIIIPLLHCVYIQLYFTSFGGRLKQRMEQTLQGYTKWDVRMSAYELALGDKACLVLD